ncbi:hypothetical protein C7212DRAFT_343668 [Tuber magnatum]|uniref:Uncharacterized protein n=1 Tax=Tuber magnatum TaxID=42249 RepID=A0A317SPX0_9PEZI|nr:hypothetical protein C7212DRAFT_343668 [Tuber magnatum]
MTTLNQSLTSSPFFPDSLRSGNFIPIKNNGATNPEDFVATNQEVTMTVTEIRGNGMRGIARGVHIYITPFACGAAGFGLSEGPGPCMYVTEGGDKVAVGDEILVKVLVMRKGGGGEGEEFYAIAGISWVWVDAKEDERANKKANEKAEMEGDEDGV